jgi:hypothetical protein
MEKLEALFVEYFEALEIIGKLLKGETPIESITDKTRNKIGLPDEQSEEQTKGVLFAALQRAQNARVEILKCTVEAEFPKTEMNF